MLTMGLNEAMPFVKGESRNAGGRPKILKDIQKLARKHAPAAIKTLVGAGVKAH